MSSVAPSSRAPTSVNVAPRRNSGKVGTPMCFREPEIPEVPDVDKPVVRNVLYTAWALQENTGTPSIGWQVQIKRDGYLVLVSYGRCAPDPRAPPPPPLHGLPRYSSSGTAGSLA
jgi:hypothetical protein